MLRSVFYFFIIAAFLAVLANAASLKSMVASQQTANLSLRDKNLLTYVGNVPENIRDLMIRLKLRR